MISLFSKRTNYNINNLNSTLQNFDNYQPSDLVYISNNLQSEIELNGTRCTKIIITDCKDCKIIIKNKITTGFFELFNCDNCNIFLPMSQIKTLQLDNLQNCKLNFYANDLQEILDYLNHILFVVNVECKNLQILIKYQVDQHTVQHVDILPTNQINLENFNDEEIDYNDKETQFKIKLNIDNCDNKVNCKLEIKKVIREGRSGYVTTKEEKEHHDNLQLEFERRMTNFVKNELNL
ncbi:hypothetical protein ABK040_009337 [Willaertia magna]